MTTDKSTGQKRKKYETKKTKGRRKRKKARNKMAVDATCERRGEKIYCRIMRGMLLNTGYYNISTW